MSDMKRRVWSSKSASSSRPSSSSKRIVSAFSEETEQTEKTKSLKEGPTEKGVEKAPNNVESKNESQKDKESAELKRDLMKALESGKKVTGKVEAVNRGGLILRVMKNKYRAFLPKSQMRSSRLKFCKTTKAELTEAEVMKQQIGNLIDVKFVEVTPKRVVCSEKSLIQENAEKKLPVGTQQRVVVTNLSDFGAFVEVINNDNSSSQEQLLSPVGLEGLIHISELSWNKVAHPRDVCRVGDELEVKVLEVANSGQRVNFSAKQMLDDPLMETLDTIMPVTMPELSFDDSDSAFASGDFDGEEGTKMEASLPGLPRICAELLSEDGVEAVIPGRTAVERRVVSQDLELWLTNVQVEDGYNLLARSGRQVQEIHVVTSLNREAIKRAIKRATRATNA